MRDPAEVCTVTGWDDVALRFNPYPPHYRAAFAFSTFLYPPSHSLPCGRPAIAGRGSGLPCSDQITRNGLGSVFSPVVVYVPVTQLNTELSNHLPFWPKPISIFGLSRLTEFINSSLSLALPLSLAPFRMMLADSLYPHGFGLPLSGMGYVVPPASYRPVTRAACGGRLLPRERQVSSWIYPCETIT
jgi:hypothetical protein